MPTKAQIISRAQQLAAGVGGDVQQSPVVDSAMTAAALFPHAVKHVWRQLSGDKSQRHKLAREFDLTFTNGEADIPAALLNDWAKDATFADDSYVNNLETLSWVPVWSDFTRMKDQRLAYFSVRNNDKIGLSTPDSPYGNGQGFNGTLQVTAPADPTESGTIENEDVANDVIVILASALRGEHPIARLGVEVAAEKK